MSRIDDRLVAISANQLKKCPKVVALAGRKYNADAIRGALKGNFINLFITDALAAEEILHREKENLK